MERAFWWDNRQNKRLSIYSFHQNESMAPSIVSFLSSCVSRSVGGAHSGGLCTVSRSERGSKRGVKLTSWFEKQHRSWQISHPFSTGVKKSTDLVHPRTQEGTGGDAGTDNSETAKRDIRMIAAHLLVKVAPKKSFPPLFFYSNTSRRTRRTSGQEDRHKIWKETLHNVAPTGNEALRMIFSEH